MFGAEVHVCLTGHLCQVVHQCSWAVCSPSLSMEESGGTAGNAACLFSLCLNQHWKGFLYVLFPLNKPIVMCLWWCQTNRTEESWCGCWRDVIPTETIRAAALWFSWRAAKLSAVIEAGLGCWVLLSFPFWRHFSRPKIIIHTPHLTCC